MIRTDFLARVEGEGAMYVELEGDRVRDVQLRIYEPPRFFEAMLRGRSFTEAADITSRICGICPIAYQISALRAMEDACEVAIDSGPIRDLRRLIYCGEWIESLTLHVYLLHAPDFLGYDGFVSMARDHATVAQRGLELKKAGNTIVSVVGGREIHPVNLPLGGFYRVPSARNCATSCWNRSSARARSRSRPSAGRQASRFPRSTGSRELVALTEPGHYPIDLGRIVSDRGLDIAPAQFSAHIVEQQVEHSNALHARLRERDSYLCGSLSRYNTSSEWLWPLARSAAREAGLGRVCHNPFQSIVVRAVEILQACDEAVAIIEGYERPDRPAVEMSRGAPSATASPRRRAGCSITATRSTMTVHPRRLDRAADFAEPSPIEQDLRAVVERHVDAARGGVGTRLRASDPQPRPVHLLRNPLPEPDHRPPVNHAAKGGGDRSWQPAARRRRGWAGGGPARARVPTAGVGQGGDPRGRSDRAAGAVGTAPTRWCSSIPCGQVHHRARSTAWTQTALRWRRVAVSVSKGSGSRPSASRPTARDPGRRVPARPASGSGPSVTSTRSSR